MARPTGSCPPGRKPLLSDRETALGRRSFRPSPCRGRHPSSPRRRGGSNIHSYFWPMWLKYSFPLVAQILVPTWLKYSLTFTHTPPAKRCPQCGKELPPSRYRPRRFCSDACRAAYWASHGEQIHRQSTVSAVCPVCHKTFQDYAKHRRKYCCHACYIAERYYGGQRNDD